MHIKHNNKIRKVKHIEVYAEPGEDNWFTPEDVEVVDNKLIDSLKKLIEDYESKN